MSESSSESSSFVDMSDRFAAAKRIKVHDKALEEIRAGQKKGHWIWWVFPPLTAYGRDMFTPDEACLDGLEDAKAYLSNQQLRKNFLEVLGASKNSISKCSRPEQGPWQVFDKSFLREPQGIFVEGPVDAFKVRACSTLFAAAAHGIGDREVHDACLGVLSLFTGECAYSDQGSGSTPDDAGKWTQELQRLEGPDLEVLRLVQADASVCNPMEA